MFPRLGCRGDAMAYLLDKHHRVICAANRYCADEQAAKERAQQLSVDAKDVELWQLDHRISHLVFALPQTLDVRHGLPNFPRRSCSDPT
jgi:hypothetical protein